MSKFFKTCGSVYSSSFSAHVANCVTVLGKMGFSMLYRHLEETFCIDPYAETLLLINGKAHSLPHKYIRLNGFEEIRISYLEDGFQTAFLKDSNGTYAWSSAIDANGDSLFILMTTSVDLSFVFKYGRFKIRANDSEIIFTIFVHLEDLKSKNIAVLQQTFSIPINTFVAKYRSIPYKDAFLHNLATYWNDRHV